MRLSQIVPFVLVVAACTGAAAKNTDHRWLAGKVLDANRARYFAGMLNNSSSHTTENGDLSATANSTSYGDSTNTQIDGSYSGTRNTSSSGSSVPMYRVYDNLVIEGTDTVYVTSERLRWRWSKGAHVAVNGSVQYYVDGRKLHVLDEDNKEHTIEILKEIRKIPPPPESAAAARTAARDVTVPVSTGAPSAPAAVAIESTPAGADIEIDGAFVGNTPSTVSVAPGSRQITVKKKGFTDWTKTLNVTGGAIHLNAELEQEQPKQ
jgi:hypothetical protein